MAFQFQFFSTNGEERQQQQQVGYFEKITRSENNGKLNFSDLQPPNNNNQTIIEMKGVRLCVPNVQFQKLEVDSSYGGGFKVWESTIDLVDYLQETQLINSSSCSNGKILDLGIYIYNHLTKSYV